MTDQLTDTAFNEKLDDDAFELLLCEVSGPDLSIFRIQTPCFRNVEELAASEDLLDVNSKQRGLTPLYMAAKRDQLDIVRLLLEHGCVCWLCVVVDSLR